MEFEQYLYDEFVAEANEHLATIEDDFLALEEQKDAPDPELVDKIFRAIHSVKGGSAFLDLNKINELSHAMENLLTLMREGETKPNPACIDALLKGVDLLSGMLADVKGSNAVDIEEIHARLTGLIREENGTEAPEEERPEEQDEPKGPTKAGSESFPDTELDLAAVDFKSLLKEYDFIYLLKYDLSETSKAGGPDPASLVKELKDAGEIVDAKMTLASSEISFGLPEGPLLLEVLFATLIGEEYIEVVTGLSEDRIIPLEELKAEEPEETPVPAEEIKAEETPKAAQDEPTDLEPKDKPAPATGKSQGAGGSVRINVDILDKLMTLAGELVLVRNQQLLSMDRVDSSSRDIIQRLDVITTGLQEMIMRTRMQPVGNVFGKLPRIVRDLSNKLGKQITISITGNEVELDKTLLESMNDPLTHVVRNCCDHGIEPPDKRQEMGKAPDGRITVRAYHEGGQINIEIKDDGAGIDPEMVKEKARTSGLKTEVELSQMSNKEIISMVMLPGFSTAKAVSAVSGRGVGMDVVKHSIEDLGGSIDLDSWPGQGTSLHLRLPLT
ncbi:MAG: chemotaxis protein CheA, partial [Thermodesulfobacteriota bacterium]|nr:chemotaxis protein CheA [Thermodesulfobacteriota bacterium]